MQNKRVLLCVSGGIDSVSMLYLFNSLKSEYNLDIAVVHINHSLRGKESDEDAKFVKAVCKNINVKCFYKKVDVKKYALKNKLSKQVAARILRYGVFKKIKENINADYIATAHNADDNVETVLLNILRGTGLRGLCGIPFYRKEDAIIRPLLSIKRCDIEKYVAQNNIVFRNDSSNQKNIYQRNLLRNKIIPFLKLKYRRIDNVLINIAKKANKIIFNLDKILVKDFKDVLVGLNNETLIIDKSKLLNLNYFLQSEIFIKVLNMFNIEPSEKRVEALIRLSKSQTGKIVELNFFTRALIDRNNIIISNERAVKKIEINVKQGKSYLLREHCISISRIQNVPNKLSHNPCIEYIDADKVKNMKIRFWKNGDWFVPFGLAKRKKLSDYFVDLKLNINQKKSIPLLLSGDDIVWVCGYRIDDRFKITKDTKRVIKLSIL